MSISIDKIDSSTKISDTTDKSKTVKFDLNSSTSSTSQSLVFNQTVNRNIAFPDKSGIVAMVGDNNVEIQTGSVAITQPEESKITDVSFASAFTTTPVLTLTPKNISDSAVNLKLKTNSIDNNGFKIISKIDKVSKKITTIGSSLTFVTINKIEASNAIYELKNGAPSLLVQKCPAVVFYDNSAGELKFARNTLPDGTGNWNVTTIISVAANKIRSFSPGFIFEKPAVLYSYGTGNFETSYDKVEIGGMDLMVSERLDGSGVWNKTVFDPPSNRPDIDNPNTTSSRNIFDVSYLYDKHALSTSTFDTTDFSSIWHWTDYTISSSGEGLLDLMGYSEDRSGVLDYARGGVGTASKAPAEATYLTSIIANNRISTAISLRQSDGSGGMIERVRFYNHIAIIGTFILTMDFQFKDIDTSGGKVISVAIVQGNPAVSYIKGAKLYYARSDDVSGTGTDTSWTIYEIDDAATAPNYVSDGNNPPKFVYDSTKAPEDTPGGTSLEVIDGFPTISYMGINNELKYARSTLATGETTNWTKVVVDDSSPLIGQSSSIVEIDNGFGISYIDGTNKTVKFAAINLGGDITFDIDYIATGQ